MPQGHPEPTGRFAVPQSLARRLASHLTAALAGIGANPVEYALDEVMMQAVSRRGITSLRTRIALLGESVK
jgi:hypothetical protein